MQKRNYDKPRLPLVWEVGQKVLLRNLKRDDIKGGKLMESWLGMVMWISFCCADKCTNECMDLTPPRLPTDRSI